MFLEEIILDGNQVLIKQVNVDEIELTEANMQEISLLQENEYSVVRSQFCLL